MLDTFTGNNSGVHKLKVAKAIGFAEKTVNEQQHKWRIQEFSRGGAPTPKVGVLPTNFQIFLPKTA